MLSELQIQNYALIRDLRIHFHEGLSTITGETGTGKSIMLGALGLILGNRADTSSLMDNDRKCVVEGKFQVRGYGLEIFFEENDLDFEQAAILRREISPNGKSRAFINDTPVTLDVMRELGEKLIDIHSQHQTVKLTSSSFQLGLLDAFAGHKPLLENYGKLFRKYRSLARELQKLKDEETKAQKEYDYNLFQLNEISDAALKEREQGSLEEELNLLSNAENIQQVLSQAIYLLYEDEQGVNPKLSEVRRSLAGISGLNPKLAEIYRRIEAMLIENKDICGEMETLNDSISVDNERMEEINLRLQQIQHLLAKHHMRHVSEVLAYAAGLQEHVNSVESISDDIKSLESDIRQKEIDLNKLAEEISSNRKAQVEALEENLISLLRQVGIPEANVCISLSPLSQLNESGKDQIGILFSANKGSKPEPVSQVASGGELSRLMLCFKYILADSIFLPTIIFDEIDTGISGEVTIKVGQMMKRLSAKHQVISITHQPQVAAMGQHHYIVYKTSGEDFTSTHIRQLKADERTLEIAKMIAGHKPSSLAMENAKELLAGLNR